MLLTSLKALRHTVCYTHIALHEGCLSTLPVSPVSQRSVDTANRCRLATLFTCFPSEGVDVMAVSRAAWILLDQLDDCWQSGVPELRTFLQALPDNESEESVAELIIADMHWRWRSGLEELQKGLADYQQELPRLMSNRQLARVLCHEFGVRSHWGDCPSRESICAGFPELQIQFLDLVERETADIVDWPQVKLVHRGQIVASAPLDRLVRAGRQQLRVQRPWSLESAPFLHQFVLCSWTQSTLSRQQIEIRLSPGYNVEIRNASRSRALRLSGGRVLDASETLSCTAASGPEIVLVEGYKIVIHSCQNGPGG